MASYIKYRKGAKIEMSKLILTKMKGRNIIPNDRYFLQNRKL